MTRSGPGVASNEATTLSELAAVAPGLIDEDADELGGWTLLSTAEAGEAQASAIAMILGAPYEGTCRFGFELAQRRYRPGAPEDDRQRSVVADLERLDDEVRRRLRVPHRACPVGL